MSGALLAALALGLLLLPAGNFLFQRVLVRHARAVYVIVVVLLCGTVVPAFALARAIGAGLVSQRAVALAPIPILVGAVAATLALALPMRTFSAADFRRMPALVIGLFAPSLAEVLVFLGLFYGLALHFLGSWLPHAGAAVLSVALTSAAFSLYHLTHAPPWNTRRVLVTLFVVWLVQAAFYAFVGNIWAAALLNTALATIGFLRNRAHGPDDLPIALAVLFDLVAVAAVILLCAT